MTTCKVLGYESSSANRVFRTPNGWLETKGSKQFHPAQRDDFHNKSSKCHHWQHWYNQLWNDYSEEVWFIHHQPITLHIYKNKHDPIQLTVCYVQKTERTKYKWINRILCNTVYETSTHHLRSFQLQQNQMLWIAKINRWKANLQYTNQSSVSWHLHLSC